LELNSKNPPALLEVRGEAYMPIKEFEVINKKLEAEGEKPFPNARNATAGTLKQLDPKLVAQRPIRAVFTPRAWWMASSSNAFRNARSAGQIRFAHAKQKVSGGYATESRRF